jgi:rhodanese-related sulfurtransferase
LAAPEVDHGALLELIASGAQVIDVLPAFEYDAAHIRGAIHLPLARLWHEARVRLDPGRAAVAYCRDVL